MRTTLRRSLSVAQLLSPSGDAESSGLRKLITLFGVLAVLLAEFALLMAVYHRADGVETQQLVLAQSDLAWRGTPQESGQAIERLERAGVSDNALRGLVEAQQHLATAVDRADTVDADASRNAMIAAADDLATTLGGRQRWIDGQTAIIYAVLLTAGTIGWFSWFRRVIRRQRALQQRLTAQQAQAASDERLTVLVKNSSDLTMILDADMTATFVSPAAGQILGYEPEQLLDSGLLEHIDKTDVPRFVQLVTGLRHESDQEVRFEMTHADGRRLMMEGVLTNLLSHPSVAGYVLTARDVTERHVIEQRLQHQAFHDGLTGLANRGLFVDRLQHALGARSDETGNVVVLFFDLDDFKEVNDRLGHAAGDEVLRIVGERLQSVIGSIDTAARLGGDEFAVLMLNATLWDGEAMAEKVRARLAAPVDVAGMTLRLRVSVGVAPAEPGELDAEQALRNADFAMQWAKGSGKSRHEVYDASLHARSIDRLELRSDLQRGLRREELVLHYQPTVCLRSGSIKGFEALVRWNHPKRGLLMPGDFVPLAEETGLVVPLGSWVLQEACTFAASLPHRASSQSISVNVATQQLNCDGFVEEVRTVLRDTGLRPNKLILELTETALLSELDKVKPRLTALRALGVRLAIDDFGTGYSSLAYLTELALDILKVDKSFIDRVTEDAQGRSITQAILTMSRELNLETVAEGVEQTDQADWLTQADCAMGQGYLWSRPIDEAAARQMFAVGPTPLLAIGRSKLAAAVHASSRRTAEVEIETEATASPI